MPVNVNVHGNIIGSPPKKCLLFQLKILSFPIEMYRDFSFFWKNVIKHTQPKLIMKVHESPWIFMEVHGLNGAFFMIFHEKS